MKNLALAFSILALPASLLAQTPGTYTAFGSGCGQSGTMCNGHDPMGTTLYSSTLPNEYAMPFTAATVTPVTGASFETKSTGGTYTVIARIFAALTTGAPDANPLIEGLMTVGPNQAMYQVHFAKPLILQAGNYFASFEPYEPGQSTAVLYPAQVSDGTVTKTGAYWRRPTSTSWSPTGIVNKPHFEILCGGSAALELGNTGVPEINKSFSFDLSQGSTGSIAVGVLGLTKVGVDLNAVAPACWLFTSLDLLFPKVVDGSGNASVSLSVPNQTSLIGGMFYNQYFMIKSGSNALGILFSNGGEGKIGG
ncbi:MAG: hypothetical protein H6832_11420 [Planctomycetes bacterium]|nr:hypothetical protein [Planctomycetota bacterium]MCB9919000.1 hypothetical protein [Planctomycetota bacterium]